MVKREDNIVSTNEKQKIKLIQKYADKNELASEFIKKFPLYYDNARIFWSWDKKRCCWYRTDDINILNLIKKSTDANTIRQYERTEIINALMQTARDNLPKEPKNTWVQFKNKIIDIKTGKTRKATSKFFIHNPIPYALGKTTRTPTIDKIFEDWVGKNYVQTLYEIISYLLLTDYPLHKIFVLFGDGLNGKSSFQKLITKFIGKENICSTELDTLLLSKFETTKLHKKLACIMGETNFNEIRKTSILKKLSGGDLVSYEYKRKDLFDDVNYAKLIIATNNLPETADKSVGFFRRILIIDFPNKFSEKKDILSEIPEIEYNNLALKSVKLLKSLLKKREFHNEGTYEDKAVRYEEKSAPLQKFLEEFTEEDFGSHIFKWEFREKLDSWLKQKGYVRISDTELGIKMKKLNIETSKVSASPDKFTGEKLNQPHPKQWNAWIGITWK
jgi:P4 family phage/plasmid primase-like protien